MAAPGGVASRPGPARDPEPVSEPRQRGLLA